jgi:pectate lyase
MNSNAIIAMKNKAIKMNLFLKTVSYSLILFFAASSAPLLAQSMFTVAKADGYAALASGGGDVKPAVVSTAADFISMAESKGSKVIVVSGNLNVGSVKVQSDKTVMGADTNSTLTGNLVISGAKNVIVQNLTITNKSGAGTGDGIEVSEKSENIFIHKCTFVDCADGSVDIKSGSSLVTVSWCKFIYPTRSSHCYPNLIGHSDNNGTEDRGRLHVTMHHNWYGKGCQQRMPRVRFGQVHVYNNYYGFLPSDPDTDYAIGVGVEGSILVEKSYFDKVNIAWWEWTNDGIQGKIEWKNLCLVETDTALWADNADVFDPPYTYVPDEGCDVKAMLTDNLYGAGNRATAPGTAHIEQLTASAGGLDVLVYPNPVKDVFYVGNIHGEIHVFIYDAFGNLIIDQSVHNHGEVSVEHLSANLYFVKIVSMAGTVTKKIIKE